MNYEKAILNIREELKNYILGNRIKSLILGISGGIDSGLCAALAKPVCDELGIPLIGRSLPARSNNPDELERAKLTGAAFCTNFLEHNIQEEFNFMYSKIESNFLFRAPNPENSPSRIRNGNLKARLRMIYLYDLASYHHGIVLSTDNYTELMLGFWTLHGDVGDYGMIQNLYKTEVYDMAEWITENELRFIEQTAITSTIEALATDGLGVTNKGDLGQILPTWEGTSREGYKEVDRVLQVWEDRFRLGPQQQSIIEEGYKDHPVVKRHLGTAFKRVNPVNIPRSVILYGPSVR